MSDKKVRTRNSFDFESIDVNQKITEIRKFAQDYGNGDISKKIESDHETYKIYLQFFKSKNQYTIDDIVVGMSLSYSWMPTILTINFRLIKENEKELLWIFECVKGGMTIDKDQLGILQKIINNSIVGTSKLLHFMNPEEYPIIDSRVCEFLFGSSTDKLSSPVFYLDYMHFIKEKLLKHEYSQEILNEFKMKISKDITLMRAVEFCMYAIAVKRSDDKRKERDKDIKVA